MNLENYRYSKDMYILDNRQYLCSVEMYDVLSNVDLIC